MNGFSPVQRSIAILLCFVLITEITGCVEYRAISKSELPDYANYQHSVIAKRSAYSLESTEISDSSLTGFLATWPAKSGKCVKVYAISDSLIKVDDNNFLYLPVTGISRVTVPKDYIAKDYVYTGSSRKVPREHQPAGKTILTLLYYVVGFSVVGSLSWWIFQNKRK